MVDTELTALAAESYSRAYGVSSYSLFAIICSTLATLTTSMATLCYQLPQPTLTISLHRCCWRHSHWSHIKQYTVNLLWRPEKLISNRIHKKFRPRLSTAAWVWIHICFINRPRTSSTKPWSLNCGGWLTSGSIWCRTTTICFSFVSL